MAPTPAYPGVLGPSRLSPVTPSGSAAAGSRCLRFLEPSTAPHAGFLPDPLRLLAPVSTDTDSAPSPLLQLAAFAENLIPQPVMLRIRNKQIWGKDTYLRFFFSYFLTVPYVHSR